MHTAFSLGWCAIYVPGMVSMKRVLSLATALLSWYAADKQAHTEAVPGRCSHCVAGDGVHDEGAVGDVRQHQGQVPRDRGRTDIRTRCRYHQRRVRLDTAT